MCMTVWKVQNYVLPNLDKLLAKKRDPFYFTCTKDQEVSL